MCQAVNEDNDDDDDDDDDDNDENMGNDNSSNMIVDAPEAPPPNLNPADMPIEEPRASNPKVAEADDGWMVVASKQNGGKRNWVSHALWPFIFSIFFPMFFLPFFIFPLCII